MNFNLGCGNTTTLFFGAHYEVKGGETTKYYFAGSTRIATRKYTIPQNMTVEYFLSDHLGSTSLTTDNLGNKISEIKYKPWGEARYSWTSETLTTTPTYEMTKYQFTSQYSYEAEFGLLFYNARMYDPALGRFTSADTIIPDGARGLDRYAYTFNNPVKYTDPTGHQTYCGSGDCGSSGFGRSGCDLDCWRNQRGEDSHGSFFKLPQFFIGPATTYIGPAEKPNEIEKILLFAKSGKSLIEAFEFFRNWGRPAYKQAKAFGTAGPYIEGVLGAATQAIADTKYPSLTLSERIAYPILVGLEDGATEAVTDLVVGLATVFVGGTDAAVGAVVGGPLTGLGAGFSGATVTYFAVNIGINWGMNTLAWDPINNYFGIKP